MSSSVVYSLPTLSKPWVSSWARTIPIPPKLTTLRKWSYSQCGTYCNYNDSSKISIRPQIQSQIETGTRWGSSLAHLLKKIIFDKRFILLTKLYKYSLLIKAVWTCGNMVHIVSFLCFVLLPWSGVLKQSLSCSIALCQGEKKEIFWFLTLELSVRGKMVAEVFLLGYLK